MTTRVMVLVPDSLPGRFAFLDEMFAGSAVHVVRDRRRADRRGSSRAVAEERRNGDRRRRRAPLCYLFGCVTVTVDDPAS